MNFQTITYWVIGVAVTVGVVVAGLLFFISPSSPNTATETNGFGVGESRTLSVAPTSEATGGDNTVITASTQEKMVFEVSDRPVTTATLIQTSHPTTTSARYVLQENGHVMDQVLDNSGGVARAISNTTIPGTSRGMWGSGGQSVILQYLEDTETKTVYLGLPGSAISTSTKSVATKIQFFPSNIGDLAVSPDGQNVAYLLQTANGADGYTAKIDGTGSKKLFNTPLSQVLISWPSLTTLLLQTKSLSGSEGAVFSVGAQSGIVAPLVYAPGITAIADKTFSKVVYQKISATVYTYVHDIKTNKDFALSFDPMPEKCVWSKTNTTVLYCAAPFAYTDPNYLDFWHQGTASVQDAIYRFDVATGKSNVLAIPGSEDGGEPSDISEVAVSPDDHYLVFIKKGDRTLWAVRLQ